MHLQRLTVIIWLRSIVALQITYIRGAGCMVKKLIINKFIIKKFIVKVLSLIGWIIVGGMYGLCWLVNKIYGVFGGFLTVMLVILFLIVSIGYKDVQQSIFLAVLESLNILVMIAGNTLEIVLELACDRLASNLIR